MTEAVDIGRAVAWAFHSASKENRKHVPREAFARSLLTFALHQPSGLEALRRIVPGLRSPRLIDMEKVIRGGTGQIDVFIRGERSGGRPVEIVLELKVDAAYDRNQLERYAKEDRHVVFIAPSTQYEKAEDWANGPRCHRYTWDQFCSVGGTDDSEGALWSLIRDAVRALPSPILPTDFPRNWWRNVAFAEQLSRDLELAASCAEVFDRHTPGTGSLGPSVHAGIAEFWVCQQWKQSIEGRNRYLILEFDPRWPTGPVYLRDDYWGNLHSIDNADQLNRLLRNLGPDRNTKPNLRWAVREIDPAYAQFTQALWSVMFGIQSAAIELAGDDRRRCVRGLSDHEIWVGYNDSVTYDTDRHRSAQSPLVVGGKALKTTSSVRELIDQVRKVWGLPTLRKS